MQPGRHLRAEFAPARAVVADEEALHQRAFHQQLPVPALADIGLAEPVIGRDHAADDDPRMERQIHHRRVMGDAADIVEEHIDARGRVHGDRGGERVGVLAGVIDAGIESQLLCHIGELVRGAGRTDDPAALELGDLAGHLADRARSGRDQHGFARLRPADRLEREIGRGARHAEHAEQERERQIAKLRAVDALDGLCRHDRVFLPAGMGEHDIARSEVGRAQFDDLGHDFAGHDRAEFDGKRVGARRAHPSAHIRIEREIERAQQHLSVRRRLHPRHVEFEIALFDGSPLRALGEEEAFIGGSGHRRPDLFHAGRKSDHSRSTRAARRPVRPGGSRGVCALGRNRQIASS